MNIARFSQLDKFSTPSSMRQKRNQAVAAAIALLAELYPKCFSIYEGRRRPLKIGIHKDILAAVDGALTPLELSNALRVYCANGAYLRSSREGAQRIDLDGNPAGIVVAEEAQGAKARLTARRASAMGATPSNASTHVPLGDLDETLSVARGGPDPETKSNGATKGSAPHV